jgi:SAM-dependent methyltransferase
MLQFIPSSAGSILDVGCSRGLFGSVLKAHDPTWTLTGIEPDPQAAEDAAVHYDTVIHGLFPDDMPSDRRFGCIIFNDVLEHVVDPWTMLRQSKELLEVDGTIVASIPNVRYAMVVRNLLFRGRWDYTDWGVLDRTHLRFFTRSSIEDLFASTGFVIQSLTPINPIKVRSANIFVGRFRDMRFQQFAVVAKVAPKVA